MTSQQEPPATCTHLDQVHDIHPRTPQGCEECLETHDALIQSFEPGEDWGWCFVDEVFLEPAPIPSARR